LDVQNLMLHSHA